jgi:UDP-glucose 4-epimerase
MSRVVLVTGVSRYLGGRFASILTSQPGVERVIGVDVVPPPHDIGSADFVRADIRNPVIAKVIARAEVDTVVHMNVIATPTHAGGRVSMKEINVIGTMQLLAACQKAPTVRRLVVKSSAVVYGSSPRDPAMFTEDTGAKVLPRGGWGKDSVEVEGYVRGFSRRRPDVEVAMLRFANIIGPGIRTGLTDYFSLPVIPTVMGFDARLQFVHEDDAVEAMRLATAGSMTGIVNVAGDGVLLLSQAARMAGRPTVPIPPPWTGIAGTLFRRTGLADFSADQMRFLSYGRGLDTTRMRRVLGLEPQHTTREAFADYVHGRRLSGPLSSDRVETAESLLLEAASTLVPSPRQPAAAGVAQRGGADAGSQP